LQFIDIHKKWIKYKKGLPSGADTGIVGGGDEDLPSPFFREADKNFEVFFKDARLPYVSFSLFLTKYNVSVIHRFRGQKDGKMYEFFKK
jgi:hypothetical protein